MFYATYCRLHVHVSASDRAVIRAARRVVDPRSRRTRADREARHQFFRAILDNHHRAYHIVRSFDL